MSDSPSNGWTEWGKYVLKELERLNDNFESVNNKQDANYRDITTQISCLKTEIEMLKLKSSVWGFAAGAIPVLILVIAKVTGIY